MTWMEKQKCEIANNYLGKNVLFHHDNKLSWICYYYITFGGGALRFYFQNIFVEGKHQFNKLNFSIIIELQLFCF